jgi:hypothetical protein
MNNFKKQLIIKIPNINGYFYIKQILDNYVYYSAFSFFSSSIILNEARRDSILITDIFQEENDI